LPVLAAVSATAITSTPEELNKLDGATVTVGEINLIDGDATVGTTAFADGDGLLHNDNGTMRVTSATTLKTYMSDLTLTTAAQTNITSVGTLTGLTTSGIVDITNATDASDNSGDTGALRTEGGASIAKKLYVGTTLNVGDAAAFASTVSCTVMNVSGDTAANQSAGIGRTAAEGIIVTGKGTTNDVTIKNSTDTAVITIATGTQVVGIPGSLDIEGDIDVNGTTNLDVVDIDGAVNMAANLTSTATGTFTTLNVTGDTAANTTAAIGQTAAEGIIVTGQGSTSDVTLKNDADGTVLTIPTGTTNVTVVGDVGAESFRGGDPTGTASGNVQITNGQWGNLLQLSTLEAGYLYYGDAYLPGYEHGTYHASFLIQSNHTSSIGITTIAEGDCYDVRVTSGWIQGKEGCSGGAPSHTIKVRKLAVDT
jgi:hypothetical protein